MDRNLSLLVDPLRYDRTPSTSIAIRILRFFSDAVQVTLSREGFVFQGNFFFELILWVEDELNLYL